MHFDTSLGLVPQYYKFYEAQAMRFDFLSFTMRRSLLKISSKPRDLSNFNDEKLLE
jgi:hypothetical protein